MQYTLQLMLNGLLEIPFEFTDDQPYFISFPGPKIHYGKQHVGDSLFFFADDLLFSREIKSLIIATGTFRNIKTIFRHEADAALPFDVFAAAFYLVSRYEEYLPFDADEHGRFPAEISLAFREGFSDVPVVNHYALLLKEAIAARYPDFLFPQKKYSFELTYDIDMAFAFREKGALRNIGGMLRSLSHANLKEIALRTRVLTGLEADPFDTFAYQFALHRQYGLQPTYFFLLGDHSMYDKNISWRNHYFSGIVKAIANENEIGIHASYDSNLFPKKIREEKERLEKISGKKVFRNRQHFLKLKFPVTYQRLLAAGITEDFTLGFASQTGFRAGIASPFYFYDLQAEMATELMLYPFAAMDAAMHYYQQLDAGAALEKTKALADAVRSVQGTFVFLAHNDLISPRSPWKGWHENFEAMIRYCNAG